MFAQVANIAVGGICPGWEITIIVVMKDPCVVLTDKALRPDAVSYASSCMSHAVGLRRSGDSVTHLGWVFSGPLGLRRLDRRGNSEVAKRFGDRRRLGPKGLVEGRDCLRFGEASRPSTFSDIAFIFARCKNFSARRFQKPQFPS
jgi:hypothetical protein